MASSSGRSPSSPTRPPTRSGRSGPRTWSPRSWRRRVRSAGQAHRRGVIGPAATRGTCSLWWSTDNGMLYLRGALADRRRRPVRVHTINELRRTDAHRPKASRGTPGRPPRRRRPRPSSVAAPTEQAAEPDRPRRHPCAASRCFRSHVPLDRTGHRGRHPAARRAWSSNCAPTRPSNRCWSTTTASPSSFGRRFPGISDKITPARCCCVTGTAAAVPTASCATASRSTTSYPAAGVAATTPSNLVAVFAGHRPRAHPPRPVGVGRQPQPARRATPRPLPPPQHRPKPASTGSHPRRGTRLDP